MKLKTPSLAGNIPFLILAIFVGAVVYRYSLIPKKIKSPLIYNKYITAFTGGEISCKSPIRVRFVDEMVKPEEVNKEANYNLFKFEPSIWGSVKWIDTRTIEFTPSSVLDHDTEFKATLALHQIIPTIADSLSTFEFQFRTKKQAMKVDVSMPSPIDNEKPQWQKIQGSVTLMDFESMDDIAEMFTAHHGEQQLGLKWELVKENNYRFSVDSILRTNAPSEVLVSWSSNYYSGFECNGTKKIPVTALGSFLHIHTTSCSYPAQSITLEFSEPIKKNQLLDGLIRIGNTDVTFTIDDNKIHVFPAQRLLGEKEITIEQNIQNTEGHILQSRSSATVVFEELYPELKSVGKGTIIPHSTILPFAFEAVNISAVDVRIIQITEKNIPQFLQINKLDEHSELKRVGKIVLNKKVLLGKNNKKIDLKNWNRHVIDLSKLIQTEPGAIYEVAIGFRKSYSLYPCDDTSSADSNSMLDIDPDEWGDADPYYYSYNSYYEDEEYDDWQNPCKKRYYNSDKMIVRNILASNLGIVTKRGSEGTVFAAVTDLLSTAPQAGVTIEIYDYQQYLLASGKTNQDGTVNIKLKGKPFLLIAKYGKQRGYLHMDNGSSLSLSRFDTGGKEYHKGMKGFIFGERDVWRPGDSIYLNFILEDKLKSLPASHPVVFELYNPQQELIRRVVKTNSVHNFYTFHTATDEDARTGTYSVKVIAGGATFEKNIKIETIIANRLKINLDWEPMEGEKKDQQLKGKMSAHWLHGAIAQNLKAEASVTFTQSKVTFKNYENYVFDDPSKKFIAETKEIFKGNLSTSGFADITADLHVEGDAPGMLKANVKARVYEPGGNFSTSYFSVPFHTYETYVGIEEERGSAGNMLSTTKEHAIKIITVDAKGKPVSAKKLTVELYKISWKWWWDATEDDEFSYNGREFAQCIQKDSLVTKNGEAQWMLRVRADNWGRYLIKVWDADGHCSGKIVYMDWPGWDGRGEEENPQGSKMLVFSANKEVYAVGENITLNIPTGFAGRALLSLESGTKVIGSYWIQAKKGMTQFTFPATKNMAPNVYAHITLLQPHAQTSNDLPIRMYGILPLRVEDPATRLHPVISMADQLKPEQKASVRITERNSKPMTYTIAIVDEGLLDLTRYKTPDVWSNFNERQALDVKTWDMFDDVSGADASKIKNLLSIGGDGSRGPLEGAKANRFKPVVMFMGPFHAAAGENRIHNFTLPNYVGSVRVIVIAAENGTYGTNEKNVAVKKPLMLLGTLPRVLGPNESFKFPVTVFAMESRIKNVSLQLEVNDLLTSTGSNIQQVPFSETGEKLISFPLTVKGTIGKATVRVIARSGKETAVYETEIEVRNPNPAVYNVSETTLDAGKSWTQSFAPVGMTGSNRATIEVSSIPPLNLTKRLDYLIHYPYGCVEQTTSSVFPQLFLNKLLSLSAARKNEVDKNIKAGIARLKTFQLNDGSLSYWPGNHETNNWGTNYAGHFMIEAERIGYILPYGFKDKWVNYQKTTARNWNDNDEVSQSYRLYLLALAKAPETGAMNRMRLAKIKSTPAIWYLAAAYHLIGQPEFAKEMAAAAALTITDYKELSNTFGSDERDKAIILQSLSIMGQKTKAAPIMYELASSLNSNEYMNTQATAYALVAIAAYTGTVPTTSNIHVSYRTKEGIWKEVNSTSPIWQYSWNNDEANTVELKNMGQGVLFAKVITTGIPAEGDKTDAASGLSLTISYLSMDGKKLNPVSISQGTDFMALVTVTNTGIRNYEQMSLTQIFPSGWEIHNTRMDPSGKTYTYDIPDYQDIRDDRINSFYDLKVRQKKTFMVLMHASYEGRFYLPTVYSEAMYDHSINARQHGMWVVVTPNAVHL